MKDEAKVAREQEQRRARAEAELRHGDFGTREAPHAYCPVEAVIVRGPYPYEADPNRPRRPF